MTPESLNWFQTSESLAPSLICSLTQISLILCLTLGETISQSDVGSKCNQAFVTLKSTYFFNHHDGATTKRQMCHSLLIWLGKNKITPHHHQQKLATMNTVSG